jgi:hypothetical protein
MMFSTVKTGKLYERSESVQSMEPTRVEITPSKCKVVQI